MAKSPNRLLASLPADAFSAISPHLKIVELKFGDVLAEAGSPIRQVYFPYSGAISLVVDLDVGMMIETAMVGHDGVLKRGLCARRQGVPQQGHRAGCRQRGHHRGQPVAPVGQ
jgi:CRP-like cAMP-binding protein